MSLREWLVVIGIVVIIGVLADGYRRMRLARKRASELSFGLEDVKGNENDFGSELPNGGARKQGGHTQKLETVKNWVRSSEEPAHTPVRDRIEPEISSLESEAMQREPVAKAPERTQDFDIPETCNEPEPVPVLTQVDEAPEPLTTEPRTVVKEHIRVEEPEPAQEPRVARAEMMEEPERVAPPVVEPPKAESRAEPKPARVEKSRPANQEKLADRPAASEILVINLLAKGGESFDGSRLLQSLLSSGMRYGDMSIFHRYAHKDGTGQILFSMANGVEPGTFDIGKLESTETPAVTIFMGLPGPREPLKAFMLMEETVRQLALDLGGELKDEHFSVLTQQTLEHYRQRIRDFERKQLTQKLAD
ncbi:cell division protein ZipA [Endozoicomonas arenosclerae]|uniref:cell division protein ZipA n=1 Tax=Endozoicomonas arenosclerae TaxID=1633495 RepID=UPI00078202B9|nr:cell division protein ZipA [Endozoicomonas arenosclerae]